MDGLNEKLVVVIIVLVLTGYADQRVGVLIKGGQHILLTVISSCWLPVFSPIVACQPHGRTLPVSNFERERQKRNSTDWLGHAAARFLLSFLFSWERERERIALCTAAAAAAVMATEPWTLPSARGQLLLPRLSWYIIDLLLRSLRSLRHHHRVYATAPIPFKCFWLSFTLDSLSSTPRSLHLSPFEVRTCIAEITGMEHSTNSRVVGEIFSSNELTNDDKCERWSFFLYIYPLTTATTTTRKKKTRRKNNSCFNNSRVVVVSCCCGSFSHGRLSISRWIVGSPAWTFISIILYGYNRRQLAKTFIDCPASSLGFLFLFPYFFPTICSCLGIWLSPRSESWVFYIPNDGTWRKEQVYTSEEGAWRRKKSRRLDKESG